MCQTCIGCGKCTGEVRPPVAPGHCPHCNTDNDPDSKTCAGCGWPLPRPAGSPQSAKN